MKCLLDTHLLLWGSDEIEKLSANALDKINDFQNELYFSVASLWELAIKRSLGKKLFATDPRVLRRGLIENGYRELNIDSEHAFFVSALPPIHKDPFDRMLVAQATVEGIVLLTADATIARYPGPVQKV